jgi:ATP-dependent helicase/nuclease subunit A
MTSNIHFISAGAGSGKTYTITEQLEALLSNGQVAPSGVIATTFTKLAAGELKERVRSKLIETGKLSVANQMEQSLIGTVNGVCGELLRRFTFEAGMPPDQLVLDEKQGDILFFQAIEQALDDNKPLIREMNAVCNRLQIVDRQKRLKWREEIKSIADSARSNNQNPAEIRDLGQASADSLLDHFPKITNRKLDDDLLGAINHAISAIEGGDDATKGTADYLSLIRGIRAALINRRMTWPEWIKLAKEKPTKKSLPFAEPIMDLAADYEKHPQLHKDIRFFAEHAFEIAADSLEAYQLIKTNKGLIDFVDQEQRLYQLLDNPAVASILREELQLLMVDEFQDTSPIQLALFLRLSTLADKVIWVGDIKQSIYGFRGADPTLMAAVVEQVVSDGYPPQILEKSWRSRPELVEYVNALFVAAFANTLQPEQVTLQPARKAISQETAVEQWRLSGSNKSKRSKQLANAVYQLSTSGRTVIDKHNGKQRPLAWGDIAILCRTNANLSETASALAAANIPTRYKRAGLLATPEATLALACLRRLIDPLDTLASAEIYTLTSSESPQDWVTARIEYLAVEDNRPYTWLEDHSGPIQDLKLQRSRLPFLTPTETLRVAIESGGVRETVYRWGPSQHRCQHRLNNLATLIRHADDYTNQCEAQHEPATAAGLILWFNTLAEAEQDSQAAGGDEQAIQLVTHHGAKGLEWPVVIAMDLDATLKPRLWGLTVTPSPHTIDLSNPLAGRTLRYWPKFTGGQSSNVPILARIDDSPEGRIANEREIEESKRLLYVSLTRPRDTLIITTNTTKQSGPWMDTLNADWMLPDSDSLTLPTGKSIRSANLVPDEIEPTAIDNYQPQWLVGLDAQLETLPLGLSPSAAPALENTTIGKVIELGERLSIIGDYAPDKLGLAMHAVIACYINGNDNKNGTIARILVEHGMQDTISASVAIESAERLIKAIETHFSPILYATELPIRYQNIHGQLLNGWIDLLVETRNGYIIIDHKASPRARSDWEEVALSYSGQLAAYAKAVSRSTAKPVAGCWVHFGVTGGLVEVHAG